MEIVFDACTLINVFCIDEDDNFLYKKNYSRNFTIAGTVCDEIKRNYRKRIPQIASLNSIDNIISKLYNHVKKDDDIKRDIGLPLFENIKDYTGHKKKENGELLSTALCLALSRENNKYVLFYTDDKPATEQFDNYFKFQQIGYIGDCIDLLVYLHWNTDNFPLITLKEYLSRLRYEYGMTIIELKKQVQKICSNSKKPIQHGDSLINSLGNYDVENINKYINKIEDQSIQILFRDFNPQICQYIYKINGVLKDIETFGIYNINN